MSIKHFKLGWKRCHLIECTSALTIEQSEEDCGWVHWREHKDEVARLTAEVERLRKAGDAMASSIQFNEEMAQDYNGPTIVHQCVQRWNAAKEGKPSEEKSPSFIEDLGNGVEKHDLLFRVPPAKEGKQS